MPQMTDQRWSGDDVRNDQVPRTFVSSGTWPDVELAPGAPLGAHYGRRIAQTLKRLMTERGLTQRDVAERSGVTHNTVGRVLRGTVYPDLATLARLERAFDADIYPAGLYRDLDAEAGLSGPHPSGSRRS